MSAAADHVERLALITAFCRGRSQGRAARELYDLILTLDEAGTDPRTHVVNAARSVYALRAANAIGDRQTEKALASLLSAFQEVRSLGGVVGSPRR